MNKGDIEVEALSVRYGGLEILHSLSFEVAAGEFVCVIGRSGSGKTTLINAIGGFIEHQGRAEAGGKVGVVFQDHAVFPWMTVEQNIRFALLDSLQGRSHLVDHFLRLAGLEDFAHRYPGQLSGGQRQRVGIARTLAAGPSVILMDEPFGSLDALTRDEMQSWLLMVRHESNPTVVFVTHDIDEAVFLGDRILILVDGEITSDVRVKLEVPRDVKSKMSKPFWDAKSEILELFQLSGS
jgi:NitT/TauT family transport system ATP-binding protein